MKEVRISDLEEWSTSRLLIAITQDGVDALAKAADIERTLVVGEGLEAYELRTLLRGIIGELAPQRQKPATAVV